MVRGKREVGNKYDVFDYFVSPPIYKVLLLMKPIPKDDM